MAKRVLAAPAPEVQHLPTLFRKIDSGEIRIPAFQRKFVWTEAQVLKLLESVYKGYPIGSVLLWRVDTPQLRVSQDPRIPFPHVEERYPLSFVLDGMQRLASLYGVVYWSNPNTPSVFNVIFNLADQTFKHFERSDAASQQPYLSLSALSSPRRLLDAQRQLAELPESDLLIDRSIELQARFQEYLVPTVAIAGREVGEVVEIFERINNTGTRLSTVDFMRALTWSEAFDLNERISELRHFAKRQGFDWSPESLVKVVAVVLGIPPIPTEMLHLRSRTPAQLNLAVDRTRGVLRRVIAFLRERFAIYSADFVPYEGQLLVLARVFTVTADPAPAALREIERWFWSISLSEGLRGKPDHYVARFLVNADLLVRGEVSNMDYRADLSPEEFLERRFIRGAALSSALVAMWARNHARSLFSGEVIPNRYYMREFGSENFASLFPLQAVREVTGTRTPSARVFANMILVTEEERALLDRPTGREALISAIERHGERSREVLESQLLPHETPMMLRARAADAFLSERAELVYLTAADLVR